MTEASLVLNMLLSIIGTTVLGISAQMQVGGWILSPLLLCAGCGIVMEMSSLVSATMDKLHTDGKLDVIDYPSYAAACFGPVGRFFSAVTSSLAPLGMICNGMIMCSDNLQFVFKIGSNMEAGRKIWACLLTFTTAIYAFWDMRFGNFAHLLGKLDSVSWLVNAACIILAWVGIGMAAPELPNIPETCRTAPDGRGYWSLKPDFGQEATPFDAMRRAAGVGSYGFYCFAVVVTVPKMKAQMAEPSKVVRGSSVAFVMCTVLFLSIMFSGYAVFGNLGSDSVIKAMTTNRPAGWWALNKPWETGVGTGWGYVFAMAITVNLLLTDGIYVPTTVSHLEGLVPGLFERSFGAKLLLRLGVCVVRTLVATSISQFLVMTNLTSSLFCVFNNILMPIVAFHTVKPFPVSPARKALHVLIFIFGIFCIVCGSWDAFSQMGDTSNKEDPGTHLRADISAECKAEYCAATGDPTACARADLSTAAVASWLPLAIHQ